MTTALVDFRELNNCLMFRNNDTRLLNAVNFIGRQPDKGGRT